MSVTQTVKGYDEDGQLMANTQYDVDFTECGELDSSDYYFANNDDFGSGYCPIVDYGPVESTLGQFGVDRVIVSFEVEFKL